MGGVSRRERKSGERWVASIGNKFIGSFASREEAEAAYKAAGGTGKPGLRKNRESFEKDSLAKKLGITRQALGSRLKKSGLTLNDYKRQLKGEIKNDN